MAAEGPRYTRACIAKMTRRDLVEYLEGRGTACFKDDTTAELRECAMEEALDAVPVACSPLTPS